MCRGKHLNVVLVRRTEDHSPEITLNSMMDAILSFVDKQKSSAAVCQCQRNAKQPDRTVPKTLQRDWAILALQSNNRATSSSHSSRFSVSHHRDADYIGSYDQIKSVPYAVLIFSQCYTVPEP